MAVVIFFLVSLLGVSFWHAKRAGSLFGYYLDERRMRGFVLAMTLVATYGSVSTFVSGPGLAWHYGLSWVVFASPQIITGFLILGVLGYKLSLISRQIGAVTVIDIIYARYRSRSVSVVTAVSTLIFFLAMMTAQFIGGAQLLSYATGSGYGTGLVLFGIVTVIFTAFGGFRAVVLTDTICAVLMLIGMFSLSFSLLDMGGGLKEISESILADSSAGPAFFTPDSGGKLSYGMLFSAWILVGFATVALPQSAVRCMAFKSLADLRLAMVIGAAVCGALMLGMTFVGVLARAVVPDPSVFGGNTDSLIPYFISHKMSPLLAGVTLVAPLAATMSTVSSLLISSSGTLICDLMGIKDAGHQKAGRAARCFTFAFGLLALFLALWPIDLIAWINLFAFGGLEIAYLAPLVIGLFWKKADARSALISVFSGFAVYAVCLLGKIHLFGMHAIVPALAVSLAAFWVSGLFAKECRDPVFFPSASRADPPGTS